MPFAQTKPKVQIIPDNLCWKVLDDNFISFVKFDAIEWIYYWDKRLVREVSSKEGEDLWEWTDEVGGIETVIVSE